MLTHHSVLFVVQHARPGRLSTGIAMASVAGGSYSSFNLLSRFHCPFHPHFPQTHRMHIHTHRPKSGELTATMTTKSRTDHWHWAATITLVVGPGSSWMTMAFNCHDPCVVEGGLGSLAASRFLGSSRALRGTRNKERRSKERGTRKGTRNALGSTEHGVLLLLYLLCRATTALSLKLAA